MSGIKTIKELLSFVWNNPHSDFYAKKYKLAGLTGEQVLDAENFSKLPLLTRTELESTPPDERLFVRSDEVEFVAYTSGTTSGNPMVIYFSSVENRYFDPTLGTEARRILIVHPPLSRSFGHTFVQQCRQAKNKSIPIFADYQNLANSAVIAAKVKADAICAIPTIAFDFAKYLEKYYDLNSIKLLIVSSETLTSAKREILQEKFPRASIANVYGSAEVGQFFLYPCKRIMEEKTDKFHVLHPTILTAELVDGELVITYADNKAMPLIRYRTGDYFEIAEEGCPCGLPGPVLRWSGRENVDKLRIGGVEIKIANVEETFKPILHLTGDKYQLHFYEIKEDSGFKIKTVIEILRENKPDNTLFSEDDISSAVTRHLLNNWVLAPQMTLGKAVEQNSFTMPEIKFVDEFSLKSSKMRRLVPHFNEN
ncbi:MAG: hypothetical protein Q7K44_00535 [Candidatus Liptonbacteria bacterium]|nr:hypothetical protein [Candidatus Liptonbacteria bacterium]